MQIGRAVGLIAIAALIGIILLHHNGSTSATTVSAHATTTAAPSQPSSTTATTPPTSSAALRPPSSVKVLVANGTVSGGTGTGGTATTGTAGSSAGSPHLAGSISSTLHAQGYDTLAPINATQNVTATIVYFQPGYEKEAAVLAQSLALPVSAVQSMPAQPPVPSLNGANVLVVAGPDLARSAATTTTTTTPHGATTSIPTTTIPTTTTVHR